MVDYYDPPPICALCERFYVPLKSGVDVFLMTGKEFDKIYIYWRADEWHCPECGVRIITRYGSLQRYHENREKIQHMYDEAKARGTSVEVR